MFDYANWADPEAKARLLLQLQSIRELVRGGAQQLIPNATAKHSNITCASIATMRHPSTFSDHQEHDPDSEFSLPPALDETIRVVMCTSGSPDDIAGREHRAIGEYSNATDELHVSHAIAPDQRTGHMLYSALIVLRPGLGNG